MAETDTAMPLEFLERQLERRETASEALAARDAPALERLLADVRAESATLEVRLAALLDAERRGTRARAGAQAEVPGNAADVDDMLGELEDA